MLWCLSGHRRQKRLLEYGHVWRERTLSNGPISPPTVRALRAALEIRRQRPVETEEDLKRNANERLAELRRRVVSPTSDRGRRQTDGLQMCIYHRHRQSDELRSSRLTQPVRNRTIDQEEQGARRDIRRPQFRPSVAPRARLLLQAGLGLREIRCRRKSPLDRCLTPKAPTLRSADKRLRLRRLW